MKKNKPRLPNYEDFYRINFIATPDYAPNQRQIAFVKSQADKETCSFVQQIILKDLSPGQEQIISAGGNQEKNPQFSPDGKQIAFLSNATGKDQIWICETSTGQCEQLTDLPQSLSNLTWSPDGDYIAFLAKPQREDLREEKQAWVVEDFGYKQDEVMGFAKKEQGHQVWVLDVQEKKHRQLTDGDFNHVMPVWAPDSKSILFVSNRCRDKKEILGMDLFSIPVEGGEIKRLTDDVWVAYYPKPIVPRFTHDGSKIIFGGLKLTGDGLPPTLLYKVDAQGGESVCIFPENDICHEATMFIYNGDSYGGYYETMQISSDDKYAYFISGWHGAGNIFRVTIEGENQVEAFTTGKQHYKSISEPVDGKMVAIKATMTSFSEVVMLNEKTHQETPLTDSNPWMNNVLLSHPDEMWVDTLDGKSRIQGWVFPPQMIEEGKNYPAVLYIHGGPTPFYGYGLTYEHQMLTANGIGLIICNPRGSTGYGPEHAKVPQAFDGTAYMDLLQYVNAAVDHFNWIYPQRLGVTGGSYGGYMTNWIAGHSDIFKAAVTQRGIANNLIQYGSSDLTDGGSTDFESFRDFMTEKIKTSPVAFADKINIPFLILHSTGDMRCPVEQAHQLFVAVKDTHPDLPVRLVLFPDSSHNLLHSERMDLRIAHIKEMVDWFKQYF